MARLNTLSKNAAAFLNMLAWSEIGPELLAKSDDGYNVCVGSTPGKVILFPSYKQHPRIYNAATNSDAAGRYQFMGRYWLHYQTELHLLDFGLASQDIWCMALIGECKARAAVEAGHIVDAIHLCSSRWASLPGNSYGQHQQKMADLQDAFVRAGGTLIQSLAA